MNAETFNELPEMTMEEIMKLAEEKENIMVEVWFSPKKEANDA